MNADVRVLLAEDDELIQQALGMALADEGFEMLAAMSGEHALSQLDSANSAGLDVALLDLMLPGMDRLDICRTLRARGDLPIIIVTARTSTADLVVVVRFTGRAVRKGGRDRAGRHRRRAEDRCNQMVRRPG